MSPFLDLAADAALILALLSLAALLAVLALGVLAALLPPRP
jgi:hypothetical protein